MTCFKSILIEREHDPNMGIQSLTSLRVCAKLALDDFSSLLIHHLDMLEVMITRVAEKLLCIDMSHKHFMNLEEEHPHMMQKKIKSFTKLTGNCRRSLFEE